MSATLVQQRKSAAPAALISDQTNVPGAAMAAAPSSPGHLLRRAPYQRQCRARLGHMKAARAGVEQQRRDQGIGCKMLPPETRRRR